MKRLMHSKKIPAVVVSLFLSACFCFGCAAEEPATSEIFAMDTYMTITVYSDDSKDVLGAAVLEIERLDSLLSTGDENSEVTALNKSGGGKISADTKYLLERSLEIREKTGGAFNIAVYPLMEAWGFADGNFRVPDEDEINELLKLADPGEIFLEGDTVSFGLDGMKIDFGGIAKGYTSARLMEIFDEYGVSGAIVSLGGNVQVYGSKPNGANWNVAIQDPNGEGYLGVLELEGVRGAGLAVVTSGGYERYFEEDGVTYHHIIDPETGRPAESGLISATVVCEDATAADALSTALFVMGKDASFEFWKEGFFEFEFILEDDSGGIYISDGLEGCFSSDIYPN